MSQTRLQMTHAPTERLVANPWNTNQIKDPANEARLRESFRRFGVFKPVIVRELVDGSLEILGGEHRWKMAKEMGLKEVPIVNLGSVDDRRAKEIGLVDNGRYGEDDLGSLGKLLSELGKDVLSFMPLSEIDFDGLLSAGSNIDLDDLDSIGTGPQPDINALPAAPTSQVMRFKIPIGDCAWITEMIEQSMRAGGFKDEDALTNAGHGLVSLLGRLRKQEI